MIKLYWVAEYIDGKNISENEVNFSLLDKDCIKYFYMIGKNITFGCNCQNGTFFINNLNYDFKLGNGPFTPIQFKGASLILEVNQEEKKNIVSRNIGFTSNNREFQFKYYLSLENEQVFFNAIKLKENDVIDSRKIKLQ